MAPLACCNYSRKIKFKSFFSERPVVPAVAAGRVHAVQPDSPAFE